MHHAIAMLVVVTGVVTPQDAPAQGVTAARIANAGDVELRELVRQSPDASREAIHDLLVSAALASTPSAADESVERAARVARAYSEGWGYEYPAGRVETFRAWSADQRRAWTRVDSLRRAGNEALASAGVHPAIRDWRQSLALAETIPDSAGIGAALGNTAVAFYRAGRLDSATVYAEQAIEVARSIGNLRTAANALSVRVAIEQDEGNLQSALALNLMLIETRRGIGDLRGVAADQQNLGLIALESGDLRTAETAFTDALALNRGNDHRGGAATNLTNLGIVAAQRGQYERAADMYAEALRTFRELGADVDAADVLAAMGVLAQQRGDYAGAIVASKDALETYDRAGMPAAALRVRQDLALAYAAAGRLEDALLELERAETASAGLRDGSLAGGLALARADVLVAFNRLADAQRQYARAEILFAGDGNLPGQAAAQEGQAYLEVAREDFDRARASFEAVLRTQMDLGSPREEALVLVMLGYVHGQSGRTALARRTLVSARDELGRLGDRVGEAAALAVLGDLELEAGNLGEAEGAFRSGLDRLGDSDVPDPTWRLHHGLGRVLRAEGRLTEAGEEFRLAIDAIERTGARLPLIGQRSAYLADKWDVYADLALVEQARGNDEAALLVSEQMRARAMRELMNRARLPARHDRARPLIEREQDLRRYLHRSAAWEAAWGTTRRASGAGITLRDPVTGLAGPEVPPDGDSHTEWVGTMQEAYSAVLTELRDGDPEYAVLVSSDANDGGGEIQGAMEALRSGEVLLVYLLTDSASSVFVVTNTEVTAIDLRVSRETIRRQVDFARGLLTPAHALESPTLWKAPLQRLYTLLIAPIESAGLLAGARRLLIAPHLELHYLPFHALLGGGHNQFLVERFEVAYVPSASVWREIDSRQSGVASPLTLVALAPQTSLLPGSRAEVEAIEAAFGDRATILIDEQATEEAFGAVAPNAGVVHIASRGVLNKPNPLYSYIELAEGQLEVREVFGHSFNAGLVVLSACETALGSGALADVPPGDDWIGLIRAFFFAGASNVVGTLWRVPDAASGAVMADFYRHLAGGHASGRALAEAQRAAIGTPALRHPYFWAGYALYGTGDG